MSRSPVPRVGSASDTAGPDAGEAPESGYGAPPRQLPRLQASERATYIVTSGGHSISSKSGVVHSARSSTCSPPSCELPRRMGVGKAGPAYSTGRAKTNRESPAPAPSSPGRNPSTQPPHPVGTAMNCRPSTVYVLGLLWCPLPHWNSHSFSPVSASRATNSPVGVPWNTSPPAVVRVDAHIGYSLRQRHFSSPETGSMAATYP